MLSQPPQERHPVQDLEADLLDPRTDDDRSLHTAQSIRCRRNQNGAVGCSASIESAHDAARVLVHAELARQSPDLGSRSTPEACDLPLSSCGAPASLVVTPAEHGRPGYAWVITLRNTHGQCARFIDPQVPVAGAA